MAWTESVQPKSDAHIFLDGIRPNFPGIRPNSLDGIRPFGVAWRLAWEIDWEDNWGGALEGSWDAFRDSLECLSDSV